MDKAVPHVSAPTLSQKYHRELLGKNLLRLTLAYLVPLVLLTIYFSLQYAAVSREGRRQHLRTVAEHQANMLDLFLDERVINLANLIDDPKLPHPLTSAAMETLLDRLKKNSNTFVDVGFFDSTGIQKAYAGPLSYLENQNYSHEAWFITLRGGRADHIITDVYFGLRQKPHFTIGVRRVIGGSYAVLRATIDPQKFYEYVCSHQESGETAVSIISRKGTFQINRPETGTLTETTALVPPLIPRQGEHIARLKEGTETFAYAWLRAAEWAVMVRWTREDAVSPLIGNFFNLLAVSLALILIVLSIIIFRAKKLVLMQIERETTTAQFEHAAKLASVGELSAGIAHEINNPLAIISEEAGLMKDLMNPEFETHSTFDDLAPHLDNIREAVFRCRDITRKLLSFVRKTDIQLKNHNLNTLMDEIVDGLLIHELAVSNIEIKKNYSSNLPDIYTDANQITQVFLNVLNNAADAITPPGCITIGTACTGDTLTVSIADTGKGISPEQMGKIFLPFYTTKEVGKGTGLGLSVSYGIIKSLGGNIQVESILGQGSVFTVVLPLK